MTMRPKRPRNLRKLKESMADWDDSEEAPNALALPPTAAPMVVGEGRNSNQGPLLQTARVDVSKTTEDANVDERISLDDLREFQKYRRHRQRGVDVDSLARGERRKRQLKSETASDGSGRDNKDYSDGKAGDKDAGGDGTVSRSLSGAFTAQTNKLDANKHMMSFIEKEMEKHQSSGGGGGGNHSKAREDVDGSHSQQAPNAGINSSDDDDDDDPYHVPSHLKVVDEKPLSEGNVAMAVKMLTSIQEVDLGAASRTKNIRETDMLVSQAKRRARDYGDHDRDSSSKSIPASPPVSSSGSRFRKPTDLSGRSSRATDDIALQRFKKRMRR